MFFKQGWLGKTDPKKTAETMTTFWFTRLTKKHIHTQRGKLRIWNVPIYIHIYFLWWAASISVQRKSCPIFTVLILGRVAAILFSFPLFTSSRGIFQFHHHLTIIKVYSNLRTQITLFFLIKGYFSMKAVCRDSRWLTIFSSISTPRVSSSSDSDSWISESLVTTSTEVLRESSMFAITTWWRYFSKACRALSIKMEGLVSNLKEMTKASGAHSLTKGESIFGTIFIVICNEKKKTHWARAHEERDA